MIVKHLWSFAFIYIKSGLYEVHKRLQKYNEQGWFKVLKYEICSIVIIPSVSDKAAFERGSFYVHIHKKLNVI
jgi:hypothetical protein